MIQLIIHGKEQTNLSEEAKKWFYHLVLNGKAGPFKCQTFNDDTKAIVLETDKQQTELF